MRSVPVECFSACQVGAEESVTLGGVVLAAAVAYSESLVTRVVMRLSAVPIVGAG